MTSDFPSAAGPDDPLLEPPSGGSWRLPPYYVDAGLTLYRFNRRPEKRFNAPDGTFGVCYLGTSVRCCFVEVFRPRQDATTLQRFLTLTELRRWNAYAVSVRRPLILANLNEDGLVQLGLDLRLTGGDDYVASRRWAKAIHDHPAHLDGIYYPSRHHNALSSVALFDRAADSVSFELIGQIGQRGIPSLWVWLSTEIQRYEIVLG